MFFITFLMDTLAANQKKYLPKTGNKSFLMDKCSYLKKKSNFIFFVRKNKQIKKEYIRFIYLSILFK